MEDNNNKNYIISQVKPDWKERLRKHQENIRRKRKELLEKTGGDIDKRIILYNTPSPETLIDKPHLKDRVKKFVELQRRNRK